jgi:serine/arginine repetitive matrix protein 1
MPVARTCNSEKNSASLMVSYQQDPFLKNKQRKLFASRTWPAEFDEKVDMTRVAIDALRPWIETRVTELTGTEDEIVSEYCVAQLEAYDPVEKTIEPREVQLNIEGFLGNEGAATFMRDLWNLLLSAQRDPAGVPAEIRVAKEKEAKEAEEKAKILQSQMKRHRDDERPRHDRRMSPERGRDRRRRSPSRSRDAGLPRVEKRKRTPSPAKKEEIKMEEQKETRRKRTPSPSPAKEKTRSDRRKRTPSPSPPKEEETRVERRKRTRSPSPPMGGRYRQTERKKRTPSPSPKADDRLRQRDRRRRSPTPDRRQRRRTRSPSPHRNRRRESPRRDRYRR